MRREEHDPNLSHTEGRFYHEKRKKFDMKVSRRKFLKIGFAGGAALFVPWHFKLPDALAQIPGGTLDPNSVPKVSDPHADPTGHAAGR